MEKFITLRSTCVPLPSEDIDTDQIIPARFLKATTREGFGDNLFRDWRYGADGSINEDFVLNRPQFKGAILVAGKNFGCGSSREHAAWAIYDYGFRVVISSFFADIFRNNALNNGILPVQVSAQFLDVLFTTIELDPEVLVEVNLQTQEVSLSGSNLSEHFDIDPYKKMCFENGYDDIDFLISKISEIKQYERSVKV